MSDPVTRSYRDNEEFLKEYIPITEFAAQKNISERKIMVMIKNGFYSGRLKNGVWFVHRDELTKKVVGRPVIPAPSSNIFLKLLKGQYGLGLTLWGWGVVGGFVFANLLLIPIVEGGLEVLAIPFILVWIAYITIVCIGVWQSDNSRSVASVASKLFIVVAYPITSFVLLYLIGLLTSDYPNH